MQMSLVVDMLVNKCILHVIRVGILEIRFKYAKNSRSMDARGLSNSSIYHHFMRRQCASLNYEYMYIILFACYSLYCLFAKPWTAK